MITLITALAETNYERWVNVKTAGLLDAQRISAFLGSLHLPISVSIGSLLHMPKVSFLLSVRMVLMRTTLGVKISHTVVVRQQSQHFWWSQQFWYGHAARWPRVWYSSIDKIFIGFLQVYEHKESYSTCMGMHDTYIFMTQKIWQSLFASLDSTKAWIIDIDAVEHTVKS